MHFFIRKDEKQEKKAASSIHKNKKHPAQKRNEEI